MIIDTFVKMGINYEKKHINMEKIVQRMDLDGIQLSVISSYPQVINNHEIIKQIKKYPNRLIPFYCANPWIEQERDFLKAVLTGFKGLVLDPVAHGYAMDHQDLLDPLLAICNQYHLPVWINTFSSFFSSCTLIDTIAAQYPNIPFILGHMGFNYDASTACTMALKHHNVYLEISGAMSINLKRAKEACGYKKILFGSGYPDINYPCLAMENVKDIFNEKECEAILGNNFLGILKEVAVCASTC